MPTTECPVVWIQLGSCSGDSVSVLNTVSPGITNLLIDEVLPGMHVSLAFHPTVMAASGELAIEAMDGQAEESKGEFLLVVEGSVETGADGAYTMIGERGGREFTGAEKLEALARDALAVIALGTCAAYGGIPAGKPNPTGAMGVAAFLGERGVGTPVVNIPGCPVHPDWFTGTIVSILLNGLPSADDLDDHGRPKAYFGQLVHENCPRRAAFDEGRFAQKPGDEGCLFELGCKGPITYSDCPLRPWNGGVNWCIGAGAPCAGCTQPEFPDVVAPLYEKLTEVEIPNIGECWRS